MKTLSQRIDEHQQTQSTIGKFGSWHQDSAARCLDLVASVIEPEIAARVAAEIARLREALRKVEAILYVNAPSDHYRALYPDAPDPCRNTKGIHIGIVRGDS